jgi:hypothetical protein
MPPLMNAVSARDLIEDAAFGVKHDMKEMKSFPEQDSETFSTSCSTESLSPECETALGRSSARQQMAGAKKNAKNRTLMFFIPF